MLQLFPGGILKDTTQTLIILLGQGNLKLAAFGADQKLQEIYSGSWESRTLSQTLTKALKKTSYTHAKIVLADNLSLVAPIFIPVSQKDPKEAILSHAKQVLAQPLERIGLDWKPIFEQDGHQIFQLFAVQKTFLSLIGKAVQNAGLTVDSVEPLASVLAQQAPDPKVPTAIIWPDNQYHTLTIAYQHHVLAASVSQEADVYNALQALLSFTQQKFQLEVTTLVLPDVDTPLALKLQPLVPALMPNPDLNPFTTKKIKKDQIFPPASEGDNFAVTSKDLFDSDTQDETSQTKTTPPTTPDSQENLDISAKAPKLPLRVTNQQKVEDSPDMEATNLETKSKPKTKFIIGLIMILVVLAGIVVGGILVYNNAMVDNTSPQPETNIQEQVNPPDQTPIPTVAPDASPAAELDKSEISIQVLNGSGVAGAAGGVEDILSGADFENISTGNADNYDYQETEISVKAGQTDLLQELRQLLAEDYTLGTTDQALEATSEYDAVIIVGQN